MPAHEMTKTQLLEKIEDQKKTIVGLRREIVSLIVANGKLKDQLNRRKP